MTDLPVGWAAAEVGDVTLPIVAVDPKDAPEDTFTYVDIGSIDNRSNRIVNPKVLRGRDAPSRARQLLQPGDTIFSTVRTYLRNIAFVDASIAGAIGSTGFSVLRPAEGIYPRFLYYVVMTNAFVDGLSAQMRGSSYPAVVDSQVRAMPIPLAPTPEQARIVAAIDEQFSRLDAGVKVLERSRARLDRLWQASLDQVFGDLASAPHESGRQVFTYVTSGSRGWAKYYSAAGPIFLRVGNVRRGDIRMDLTDAQRVTPPPGAEGTRTLVQPGDVLITITADIGRVAVVPQGFGEGYINQHVAIARPRKGMNAEYLAWFITSTDGQRQLNGLQRGMTKIGLGLDDIRALRIPIPAPEAQDAIAKRLGRVRKVIDENSALVAQQVVKARRLRSSVLSAAFTGNLVRQDPEDEPAAALLERIAAKRASSNTHKTAPKRPNRVAIKEKLA